jgi:diacylglycerol kinase (ATP)
MAETVIISSNPKSGAFSRQGLVVELQKAIESLGFPCEIHTNLDQMASRCVELASSGSLRAVVAAGGDGTAARVASLIPSDVPLALFPTGSENLLAKFFSIAADPMACARSIEKLRTKPIDVMMVNGNLFLLMASIGFDAEVVRTVHQSRRSHVSKLTYWSSIFKMTFQYRWPKVNISIMDEKGRVLEVVSGGWVFVFNVPRYAAGLPIMMDAIENDGYLDIGVFEHGGLFRNMWYYWNVIRGKHHQMKHWRRFHAYAIRVEMHELSTGKNAQTSCQADGDWVCELPVDISIVPRTLQIVV